MAFAREATESGHEWVELAPGRKTLVPAGMTDAEILRRRRQCDNKNFESASAGVHPDQVPEANRLYKDKGVTFNPETGDAIFKDIQSKNQHMIDRGMFSKNDTRSPRNV